MASFGLMSGFLVLLPVLIAQWVGVVGLRRADKNGAWWTMTAGTACSTLGTIASLVIMPLMYSRLSGSSGVGLITTFAIASGGLSMLGSLLFAIGFAIHGLRASRAASRMQDLELLTTAMSEEIDRLKEKPRP